MRKSQISTGHQRAANVLAIGNDQARLMFVLPIENQPHLAGGKSFVASAY